MNKKKENWFSEEEISLIKSWCANKQKEYEKEQSRHIGYAEVYNHYDDLKNLSKSIFEKLQ